MNSNSAVNDILIIGGGINGTGIAADAAGRGLSVILCEQNDLASGTSSASSKLIHGGLRYLEQFEFRLVHEALGEREILLQKAPHIIHPMQFVMPYTSQTRPAWMIRLGLFLYDHLAAHKKLAASTQINLSKHLAGQDLKTTIKNGFIYSDCWVDDARLVILNAIAAKQNGATILTQTQFVSTQRKKDFWEVQLKDSATGTIQNYLARILINAAGPWVDNVSQKINMSATQMPKAFSAGHIRLVKGSHIVVPKFTSTEYAYVLQHTDKRIIFVEPYLEKYNLIGTTEVDFVGIPDFCEIEINEINYLCNVVNQYFRKNITAQDIIWSYSGLRPLQNQPGKDKSATTRNYSLELNTESENTPLLSIFGGKITTYRCLAEHAIKLLKPYLPNHKPAWTAHHPLPGGDIPNADIELFMRNFQQKYSWLPSALAKRYVKNYGSIADRILQNTNSITDLGEHIAAGLYEREVKYLIQHEWAKNSDDILWRRTKLGLEFSTADRVRLDAVIEKYSVARVNAANPGQNQ